MKKNQRHLTPVDVEYALRDLESRTLAKLEGDFAKLIYLASTRDYNSGRYEHDGLSFHFTRLVADQALAAAHREVFVRLALSPLKTLVAELDRYIHSGCARPDELVKNWNDLEAYRILSPAQDDPLTVKLFISNVKIALAMVGPTWKESPRNPDPQCASQLPSPVR
jgi:hypothetical protein